MNYDNNDNHNNNKIEEYRIRQNINNDALLHISCNIMHILFSGRGHGYVLHPYVQMRF